MRYIHCIGERTTYEIQSITNNDQDRREEYNVAWIVLPARSEIVKHVYHVETNQDSADQVCENKDVSDAHGACTREKLLIKVNMNMKTDSYMH